MTAASADDISPRIGLIQIYGAHKVSLDKIRTALGVHEGSPLPPSKSGVEERLDKLSGVVASRLEATCCVDGKSILYVGIEEKDSPHFDFRPEPQGNATLPKDLVSEYEDFLDTVNQSIRLGETGESLSNGYSVMDNPGARKHQQAFVSFAARDLNALHQVIRESSDPDQRAIAAYVLQYGPRGPRTTTQIVNDLQYALQDGDDTVRKNAIRALTAMYVGARFHPEDKVTVQPTWFVELLNSIDWSDRRNATQALVDMTEDHNADTLNLIRDRALPSVVEMANWTDLASALPAFILTGRLAGLSEKEIQAAWVGGNREEVIKQVAKSEKKPFLPFVKLP
jgi:hypothetical protein